MSDNKNDNAPQIYRFPSTAQSETPNLVTADQLKRLEKLIKLAGWDIEAQRRWLDKQGISSIKQCSHGEAARLIDRLTQAIESFGGKID